MFDVGDLPVLSFGNCVLKTGVIKWPLKLYVRFSRFFFKIQKKHDLTFFFGCCTRFLERRPGLLAGNRRELDGGAGTSIVLHGVIGTVLGVAAGRPAPAPRPPW